MHRFFTNEIQDGNAVVRGEDVMQANDSVIVVTAGRILEDLHDIFM